MHCTRCLWLNQCGTQNSNDPRQKFQKLKVLKLVKLVSLKISQKKELLIKTKVTKEKKILNKNSVHLKGPTEWLQKTHPPWQFNIFVQIAVTKASDFGQLWTKERKTSISNKTTSSDRESKIENKKIPENFILNNPLFWLENRHIALIVQTLWGNLFFFCFYWET